MIRKILRRPALAVLLAALAICGVARGGDSLTVSANVPAVIIAPRNSGRNFLELPALEFLFEVRASCSAGRSPKSLSLGIADSRKSLAASEIASDGPTELRLEVPANQLAPLAVENFCVTAAAEDDNAAAEPQTLLSVAAALSAQASLLCEGENDQVMTYVSRPLDVSLECALPAEAQKSRSE